jgi:AraC-like DNA-binding protein
MSLISVEYKNFINKTSKTARINMPVPHKHDHYELYFLTAGERLYFIKENSFHISENTIVVVKPGVFHMTGGEGFTRYLINIFPNILNAYQKKYLDDFPEHPVHLGNVAMNRILPLLNELQEIKDENPFAMEKKFAVFSYIIFLLNQEPIHQKTLSGRPEPIIVSKIIVYIQHNITEKLSLELIAKEFNYSISYIMKIFKEYTNNTLTDYIMNVRFTKVKKLLEHTTLSIATIAEQCGFSSENYLSLSFKKREKISPSAYRKLKRT